MSKKKELDSVTLQIRIKRCSELNGELKGEYVLVELVGPGQKGDEKGTLTKKKKLWKTPTAEVTQKRAVGFGNPLCPIYLLSRRIPTPGPERVLTYRMKLHQFLLKKMNLRDVNIKQILSNNLERFRNDSILDMKPEPLEVTFKLKHVQGKKKPKTVTAWKVNIMRFYKVTDHVNTVLFKQEHGPRITINVVDITELHSQSGQSISDYGKKLLRNPEKSSSGRNSKKMEKTPKRDVHGHAISDSESDSDNLDQSEGFGSSLTESELSVSENRIVNESVTETEENTIEFTNTIGVGMEYDNPEFAQFSLKSIVHDDKNYDTTYKGIRVRVPPNPNRTLINSPYPNPNQLPLTLTPTPPPITDHLVVIIIGNSGVGKSSLMSRWIRDDFNLNMPNTIHVELSVKSFLVDGKIVKVQFWDTAGQERFNSITRQYYRGAHGTVLVYDITNRSSYERMSKWLSEVREINSDAVFLMIGNKCDLLKREVEVSDAVQYSKQAGVAFLETSAATGNNCSKAMQLILQDIHAKQSKLHCTNLHPSSPLKVPHNSMKLETDHNRNSGEEGEVKQEEWCSC